MDTTEHDIFCDCYACLTAHRARVLADNIAPVALEDFADQPEVVPPLTRPYKAAQIAKAAELIEHGAIVRDGRIYRVTASDGVTHYETDPYRQTCTCTAGQHGRQCYHLAAASVLAAA